MKWDSPFRARVPHLGPHLDIKVLQGPSTVSLEIGSAVGFKEV